MVLVVAYILKKKKKKCFKLCGERIKDQTVECEQWIVFGTTESVKETFQGMSRAAAAIMKLRSEKRKIDGDFFFVDYIYQHISVYIWLFRFL